MRGVLIGPAAFVMVALSVAAIDSAGQTAAGPEVSGAIRQGESSIALRDAPAPQHLFDAFFGPRRRLLISRPEPPFEPDRAVQPGVSGPAEEAGISGVTIGESFDGIGQGFTGPGGAFRVIYDPPDTNIAVGPSEIVEMVNTAVAVYDKASRAWVSGPTDLKAVWGAAFPDCELDDGDPIVLYDRMADRWVLTELGGFNFGDECVAVSETSDAAGKYYLYEFKPAPSTDYPKLSVWPDAYYLTANEFANSGAYLGAGLCALDRASMLTGAAATMICFNTSTAHDTVLSSDLDGPTLPPAGSPNYMLAVDNNTHSNLAEWQFHVDFTTPSNSTLTGPVLVPVPAFNGICPNTFNCVPQKGTKQKIDALGNLVMFRLAYRNFGSYESITAVHTVSTAAGGTVAGERWYEIRDPGSTNPTVYQESTWSPDSTWRFMASIAQDRQGNFLMGYSAASSAIEPGVRFTGRLASDPLSRMRGEGSLVTGKGYHTENRWGDYSSLLVDPADDCTFWYADEYQTQNGTLVWRTRLTSLKWSGCN